jgi:hydroxymethylpyrimidine pyrophosphatase-like HAD family hydrolase
VNRETLAAAERLRQSGRKLLLVTGRELDDLRHVCPQLEVFDCIVAENGALLYYPQSDDLKLLGPPPDEPFVLELRRRGVSNLSVGKVIVATWEPHETVVLEAIRDLGLGLQVIFNKGAVMVLPSGITKASGLIAALKDMGLSRDSVVGIGDAENDHALLEACHCGIAVANAVPALKERADWVTPGDHGLGVSQLIDRLLEDDLQSITPRIREADIGESVPLPHPGSAPPHPVSRRI